jgi:hypothetical protein
VVGAGICVVNNAFVGIAVSVEMTFATGAQEAKIREISKMVTIILIFIDILLYKEPPKGVRQLSRSRWERGLAVETGKTQSHEKAILTVSIQPSACTSYGKAVSQQRRA